MVDSFIKEKLDIFLKPFFTKKRKLIGVEFEYAIINLEKNPVDISVIHKLNTFLVKFMDFNIIKTNSFDETAISFKNNKTDDLITYECSLNTLEFALEPNKNLIEASKRFYNYFEKVQSFLLSNNHILTGLGINPFFERIDTRPLNSDYYIQMYKFLAAAKNYDKFHSFIDFCSFTCASQTQLDVDVKKIPETLNFLNRISWISAQLFSNSAILSKNNKKIPSNFCTRDYLLDYSYFGFNSNYIGVDNEKHETFDNIYEFLAKVPMTYAKRFDRFYFFEPIPFEEYFYRKNIVPFKNLSGDTDIFITPGNGDLDYFRPKKNITLTKKGTIEIRQDCQQRPMDSFSTAAFYIGVLDVIPEVNRLLENYNYQNSELRNQIINGNYIFFGNNSTASVLILKILDLINAALLKRNFGEEKFIQILYKRAERLCSPASENLNKMKEGEDIISIIKHNSK